MFTWTASSGSEHTPYLCKRITVCFWTASQKANSTQASRKRQKKNNLLILRTVDQNLSIFFPTNNLKNLKSRFTNPCFSFTLFSSSPSPPPRHTFQSKRFSNNLFSYLQQLGSINQYFHPFSLPSWGLLCQAAELGRVGVSLQSHSRLQAAVSS